MQRRLNSDSSNVDTIISIVRARVVIVGSALGDVVPVLPCVRRLTLANRDLFDELIRVMDEERDAVDAVATVLRVELKSISPVSIERILFDEVTALVVLPYVRCVYISDVNGRVMEVTRIDIETQCDDAIATMDRTQCIVIQTDVTNETRFVSLGHTPT